MIAAHSITRSSTALNRLLTSVEQAKAQFNLKPYHSDLFTAGSQFGNNYRNNPTKLADALEEKGIDRSPDQLMHGNRRGIDHSIIEEVILRANHPDLKHPIRILEFGAGQTIPECQDIGSPHIARALGTLNGVEVHAVESSSRGTHTDLEKDLFGVNFHTSGWENLKEVMPEKSCDVIFARHLFPPGSNRECESILRIAKQFLKPDGVILFSFDVNDDNVDRKYRKFVFGNQYSTKAVHRLDLDVMYLGISSNSEQLDSTSWLALAKRNEKTYLPLEENLKNLTLLLLSEDLSFQNLDRNNFEKKLSEKLGCDYEINSVIRGLLKDGLIIQRNLKGSKPGNEINIIEFTKKGSEYIANYLLSQQ